MGFNSAILFIHFQYLQIHIGNGWNESDVSSIESVGCPRWEISKAVWKTHD